MVFMLLKVTCLKQVRWVTSAPSVRRKWRPLLNSRVTTCIVKIAYQNGKFFSFLLLVKLNGNVPALGLIRKQPVPCVALKYNALGISCTVTAAPVWLLNCFERFTWRQSQGSSTIVTFWLAATTPSEKKQKKRRRKKKTKNKKCGLLWIITVLDQPCIGVETRRRWVTSRRYPIQFQREVDCLNVTILRLHADT